MKIRNNMNSITHLITLIFFALTIFYSGCATNTHTTHVDNRDHAPAVAYSFEETKEAAFPFHGLIVEEKINNKLISQEELNSNTAQIQKEAHHLDMSVVSYLHAVNANKVKRVTSHDLLPDPFLVVIPRRTAQNKSFNWQGGVSNVPNAKYEVRLQNDVDNELLYLSPTLEEARQYVRKYMPFHDNLYVYEKTTGDLIYAPGNALNTGWAKFE